MYACWHALIVSIVLFELDSILPLISFVIVDDIIFPDSLVIELVIVVTPIISII